ncbi:unnamed protein product [Rhizoctonia solani]|uniref:DNA repair metallo-beta-lactamase domain-containing protein n=1 Tax=Rhizoctonia solani TaxID=456999 RepID=A0A8H2WVZ5_9AGAM|nr:unnamed protein product [Rhizoctonia solani]
MDLSFSDPIELQDHELQTIEDDPIESTNLSYSNTVIAGEALKCLGNQLLADSVELGTCRICGLVFLDSTEKEVNEHFDACLAKPSGSTNGDVDPRHSVTAHTNSISYGSRTRSSYEAPQNTNTMDTLMASRKENEAWEAVDAANNAKRDANAQRFGRKQKASIGTKDNSKKRKPAPFYKVMPGMPIAVDAFCYGKIPGVTAYFLSHAHSDHYTNLSSSWKNGPIYCSLTTANLIKHMLRVDPKWVKALPDNQAVEIPDTGGVKVTLIDANHCKLVTVPRIILVCVLRKTNGRCWRFPYQGFVRRKRSPIRVSTLWGLSCMSSTCFAPCNTRTKARHRISRYYLSKSQGKLKLYTRLSQLTNQYYSRQYCFPPQAMVIDACAELAKRYVQGDKAIQAQNSKQKSPSTLLMSSAGKGGWFKPSPKMLAQIQSKPSAETSPTRASDKLERRVLVVVGTYTIGKERVLKAIAKALSSKIYCNSRKHAVFMCQADATLHEMLTKDSATAQVHVLPLGQITIEGLSEYLTLNQAQYDRILGFRPTGWTYTPPAGQNMAPTVDQILAQAQTHEYTASDLRPQRGSNPRVTIYGVPYSEHSSFRELTCFALSIDWGRMIATVNVGSAESRQKMQAWFEKWAKYRRERTGAIVEYRCEDYW